MHNIEYYSYGENIKRDYVQRELDSYVAHADWQEGCSGLYHDIRWLESEPVCADEEAARETINRRDRGNYDQLAVRYYEPEPIKNNKAFEAMLEKAKAAYSDYLTKDRALYPETLKAEFIGCKGCGSRLSRVHLKFNRCPVCHADLRPKSALNAVASAETKWRKANKAVDNYKRKHATKKVMWLVKIEYHT